MDKELNLAQKNLCARFGARFVDCDLELRVGISLNIKDGARPINGVRVNPVGNTNGWYIWGGEEWSDSPDFFVPLDGKCLQQWAPLVLPYLALPPGWRFLVTEEYEDAWEDTEVRK